MARLEHLDPVTYSACCSTHQYYDDNSRGVTFLTCMDCPPTTHSQFLREVAFSWPPWRVRQLRTALPSIQGQLVAWPIGFVLRP
jgi:hypothetical protein